MADLLTLRAEPRGSAGKGASRAVRRDGRVPGILYGDGQEPVLITLDPQELSRAANREGFFARLLDVELGGSKLRAIPREVQRHPATDKPLHVDFMRVGAGSRITVGVPVHFLDQEKAPGLRRGGILNVVRHTIELVCNVDSIPDVLNISLDGLDIGDSIHISAIALPPGTRPTIARNFTIASIAAPTAVREEQAAAAAAAAAAASAAAAGTEAVPAAGATPAAPGATPAAGAAAPAAGAAAPAAGAARGGAAAPKPGGR